MRCIWMTMLIPLVLCLLTPLPLLETVEGGAGHSRSTNIVSVRDGSGDGSYNCANTAGNTTTLLDAKKALTVLQDTWYNTTTAAYRWNGRANISKNWWEEANSLRALCAYTVVSNDTSFVPQILNSFAVYGVTRPDGVWNDDRMWWLDAFMQCHRIPSLPAVTQQAFVDAAVAVWDIVVQSWDDHCGGGVWWDPTMTYKNAITNELFLLSSASLYQVTGNKTYLYWADKELVWFMNSGMMNAEGLINDGLNSTTCQNNNHTTYTYNQGVILDGLAAIMPSLPPSSASVALDFGIRIANATIETLVYMDSRGGVLRELCEVKDKCSEDDQQFKGVFMRSFRIFADSLSDTALANHYVDFIRHNADVAYSCDQTASGAYGIQWVGPPHAENVTFVTQTSAVDLLTAAGAA
eukprot:TRINITY_DN5320_c0_g1_i2.p1 TRINITY_DN5320_c0_g1~~TRINITY_DN5320_c0_g1_i2.p1  ORF type:complete len:408 (+),score=65.36 TRINITY_DN5320_c0_g1_i2:277-1500(+)